MFNSVFLDLKRDKDTLAVPDKFPADFDVANKVNSQKLLRQ